MDGFSIVSDFVPILPTLILLLFSMKRFKKTLLIVTALTVAFIVVGTTSTYAYGFGGVDMTTLVERIATKFGLKTSEVQSVFDGHRAERQREMQDRFSERLDEMVSAGKITKEQKALIIAKHTELQSQRGKDIDTWRDLTPQERRAQMQKRRDELEAWAKEHGIDVSSVFLFGRGMGRGMGPTM